MVLTFVFWVGIKCLVIRSMDTRTGKWSEMSEMITPDVKLVIGMLVIMLSMMVLVYCVTLVKVLIVGKKDSISSLLTARGGASSTGFIRLAHAQFEYLISTKSPVTPDELRTAYIFR